MSRRGLCGNHYSSCRSTHGFVHRRYHIDDVNMVFVSGLEDLVQEVVDGLRPGLQYRLLDLSTGVEHPIVYNFPADLIMQIRDTPNQQQLALISRQVPVQPLVRDAALLAGGLDVPDGLRADTEKEPWVPSSLMLQKLVTGGFVLNDGHVSVQGTLLKTALPLALTDQHQALLPEPLISKVTASFFTIFLRDSNTHTCMILTQLTYLVLVGCLISKHRSNCDNRNWCCGLFHNPSLIVNR